MKLIRCLALSLLFAHGAAAQIPELINYQGRLVDGGGLVNGSKEIVMRLETLGGTELYADTQTVLVVDGLYTFSIGASNTAPGALTSAIMTTGVWLEVVVSGTPLSPREQLQAVPYALKAGGVPANTFWELTGNAGTVTGTHFIGTTDDASFEVRVRNERGLLIVPDPETNGALNIIGGNSSNVIESGVRGAVLLSGGEFVTASYVKSDFGTIGGGGANRIETNSQYASIGGGFVNHIQQGGNAATIGGGDNNTLNSYRGTIAGGENNFVHQSVAGTIGGGYFNAVSSSTNGTIAGGNRNEILQASEAAAISGGSFNKIDGAENARIGGGLENDIGTNAAYASIAGGRDNAIGEFAFGATIGGGRTNQIESGASDVTIAGGHQNTIESNATISVIGGGEFNFIRRGAQGSTIAGGSLNFIEPDSDFSTIGGGGLNAIDSNTFFATVGGGLGNRIFYDATYATISGGRSNSILFASAYATIGGGDANEISFQSYKATIGGGQENIISSNSGWSSIGGGFDNTIDTDSTYARIGGGVNNQIDDQSSSSTIGGGQENRIHTFAPLSTIGGGWRNAISPVALHATIPGGYEARARRNGQLAYANGSFSSEAGAGDAQFSLYVMRRQTSDATPTPLLLDGFSAASKIILETNQVTCLDFCVVGSTTNGGVIAGYELKTVVQNFNGTILVPSGASTNFTVIGADGPAAGWTVQLLRNNADDSIDVMVVGTAATEIRWVGTAKATELMFP